MWHNDIITAKVKPPYKIVVYFWWSAPTGGAAIDDLMLLPGPCKQYQQIRFPKDNCKDTDANCKKWSKSNECKKNPGWMKKNCPVSCKECVPCEDKHSKCAYWSEQGECAKNKQWMLTNCPRSCLLCIHGCFDHDTKCAGWAKVGECTKNYDWMSTYCPRSCKRCTTGSLQPLECIDGDVLKEDKTVEYSASSTYSGCRANMLGVNYASGTGISSNTCNCWCSGSNQARGSWIQMKFKSVKKIFYLRIKRPYYQSRYTIEATFKYSLDGEVWHDVINRRNSKIFREGSASYAEPSFKAVYLRMYPIKWTPHETACTRLEVYGCSQIDKELV
ncbi:uncharacterized protein LOC141903319 [Tubulanus polymorphus]|uniref:uncharacterized protein LOC141903319 n=1 Tax=Tubulanus polymorphus TaxID=672921 RepID=UPI003DA31732